jgi:uncharacterized SAM-dependent methyltransferase
MAMCKSVRATRAEFEADVATVVPSQHVTKLLAELAQLRPDASGNVRWVPPPGLKYCAGGTALQNVQIQSPQYRSIKMCELRLLDEKAATILAANKSAHHWVVDLGSGPGAYCKGIVTEALRHCQSVTYTPLDTSPEAIDAATELYASDLPAAKILPHLGSWDDAMQTSFYKDLPENTEITATLMGSTAGNFPVDYMVDFIQGFLSTWEKLPFPAKLVVFVDAAPSDRKPTQVVIDAYEGKEILDLDCHMMKMVNASLDLDFSLDKFKHCIDYDFKQEALVRWWEAVEDFPVSHHGKPLTLVCKGTRIQTEISRKFSDSLLQSLAERAGAHLEIHRTDDDFYKAAIFTRGTAANDGIQNFEPFVHKIDAMGA